MNILFILCDQYRNDCLGCAGHSVVETPNLDSLAGTGTLFRHAYTPCPSCIAARASLFTGLHPTHTNRLGYQDCVPWQYPNMLAEVLGNGGYQTHCVGKTHFYPQRVHCGFHSLESYEARQNFDGLYVNDYEEWLREKTGGAIEEFDHGLTCNSWATRPSPLPEELHNNSWVAKRGIEFIRRRDKTRPFFLNLSFHRPHPPIDPPQVFWDLYRDRELPPVPLGDWAAVHDKPVTNLDAWEGRLNPKLLALARRGYYAQVAHIDSQIGRVLQFIRRSKCGPTAVIFTADHGEMLGDHHLFRKTYAYEGSAGVPLIISIPNVNQQQIVDAPVVLEDLYPTICSMAGLALPQPVDGLDLLPVCRNEGTLDRDCIHGEHSSCYSADEAMQFLTDGREKYIWFTQSGREQLFNLSKDPTECRDLATEPGSKGRLQLWRDRLIKRLATRPQDGLSDGSQLIPGLTPAVRTG